MRRFPTAEFSPVYMRLPLEKSTPSGGRTQGIRSDKLTTRLIEGAQDRQIRVRTPRPWPERAGLVSLDLLKPAEPAVAALKKKGIIVSEKDGYVRAGVHFYNNEDDIDRMLEAVTAL